MISLELFLDSSIFLSSLTTKAFEMISYSSHTFIFSVQFRVTILVQVLKSMNDSSPSIHSLIQAGLLGATSLLTSQALDASAWDMRPGWLSGCTGFVLNGI